MMRVLHSLEFQAPQSKIIRQKANFWLRLRLRKLTTTMMISSLRIRKETLWMMLRTSGKTFKNRLGICDKIKSKGNTTVDTRKMEKMGLNLRWKLCKSKKLLFFRRKPKSNWKISRSRSTASKRHSRSWQPRSRKNTRKTNNNWSTLGLNKVIRS